jgi:hypothetical protein
VVEDTEVIRSVPASRPKPRPDLRKNVSVTLPEIVENYKLNGKFSAIGSRNFIPPRQGETVIAPILTLQTKRGLHGFRGLVVDYTEAPRQQ